MFEVSGKEFYDFVNSISKEKRYFIRLTDNLNYDQPEIIAETTPEMYKAWKKEYDAHRYLKKLNQEYEVLPLEEEFFNNESESLNNRNTEAMPEECFLRKYDYQNLKQALESLAPAERELINLLYLRDKPMTQREAAEHFGISLSALHKRKEKILKKLRCFW